MNFKSVCFAHVYSGFPWYFWALRPFFPISFKSNAMALPDGITTWPESGNAWVPGFPKLKAPQNMQTSSNLKSWSVSLGFFCVLS